MKKKDLKQLRTMKVEDLVKRASALRDEILKTKMDIVSGKETNTRKARNLRHELAQTLTIKGIIESESAKQTEKKEVKNK